MGYICLTSPSVGNWKRQLRKGKGILLRFVQLYKIIKILSENKEIWAKYDKIVVQLGAITATGEYEGKGLCKIKQKSAI